MKITILKPVEFEAKFLKVKAGVRYPEDSEFIEVNMDEDGKPYTNYISDDEENPKMPFMEVEYDKYGHKSFYWQPTIDPENGVIINWPKGVKAHVFYKVCDDFRCTISDENDNEVLQYKGYVPEFMAIEDEGYGDYIDMVVDGNGTIKGWWFDNQSMNEIYEIYNR